MKKFVLSFRAMVVVLSIALSSCTDDDKKEPECGCDGTTTLIIDKASAAYIGNGFFSIEQTNGGNGKYLLPVKACGEIDISWIVSIDSTTFNYTISGEVKKECTMDGTQPIIRPITPFRIKELAAK